MVARLCFASVKKYHATPRHQRPPEESHYKPEQNPNITLQLTEVENIFSQIVNY